MDSDTLRINIIRSRRENPCATLKDIGVINGVTKEYIRQVLQKAGHPTVAYRQHYLCIECGKDIGTRTKKRLYCNRQCRSNYAHVQIACSQCGELKEYRTKQVINLIEKWNRSTDLFFCSKICQGQWLGTNFGVGKKSK